MPFSASKAFQASALLGFASVCIGASASAGALSVFIFGLWLLVYGYRLAKQRLHRL